MPQHTAERLCLSGRAGLFSEGSASSIPQARPSLPNILIPNGKPKAYRYELRQSRKNLPELKR
jgi:hypothetical protein